MLRREFIKLATGLLAGGEALRSLLKKEEKPVPKEFVEAYVASYKGDGFRISQKGYAQWTEVSEQFQEYKRAKMMQK